MEYAIKRSDVNLPPPDTLKSVVIEDSIIAQQEGFNVIDAPNICYLNGTRKIEDFAALPLYSPVTSVTDGVQTVTFDRTLQRGQVPTTWADWGLPPNVETTNPAILESLDSNQLVMTLSQPSQLFGFEFTPNTYSLVSYTADFYSGTTLLGSITRSFQGSNSGRLFAGYSALPIDRVVLHGDQSLGFAIAQIRYAIESPFCVDEPTVRIIPFTTTITTPFDVLSIGAPQFSGFNVDLQCELNTCQFPMDIPLPDNSILSCCIAIDKVSYNGTAKLLLTIPAVFDIAFPGPVNITLYGASDINVNQICYYCPGAGSCDAYLGNSIVINTIQAVQNTPTVVVISGTVRFVCP